MTMTQLANPDATADADDFDNDELAEVAAASAPDPRPAARPGLVIRLPRLRVVLAVLLVAALATVAFTQWRRASDVSGEAATRKDVGVAASQLVEAVLSYQSTDLESARQRVLALATAEFDQRYTDEFTTKMTPLIQQLQASATGTVVDVYVAEMTGDTARSIVVADQHVTTTAGTRTLDHVYLQVELARQNGTWLVSAVTPIGANNEALTAPTAPSAPQPPAG